MRAYTVIALLVSLIAFSTVGAAIGVEDFTATPEGEIASAGIVDRISNALSGAMFFSAFFEEETGSEQLQTYEQGDGAFFGYFLTARSELETCSGPWGPVDSGCAAVDADDSVLVIQTYNCGISSIDIQNEDSCELVPAMSERDASFGDFISSGYRGQTVLEIPSDQAPGFYQTIAYVFDTSASGSLDGCTADGCRATELDTQSFMFEVVEAQQQTTDTDTSTDDSTTEISDDSNEPNIIAYKNPTRVRDGRTIRTTVYLENTGGDMSEPWIVESGVLDPTLDPSNPAAYLSGLSSNEFGVSQQLRCDETKEATVHREFRLEEGQRTQFTLESRVPDDFGTGQVKVYLASATQCSPTQDQLRPPFSNQERISYTAFYRISEPPQEPEPEENMVTIYTPDDDRNYCIQKTVPEGEEPAESYSTASECTDSLESSSRTVYEIREGTGDSRGECVETTASESTQGYYNTLDTCEAILASDQPADVDTDADVDSPSGLVVAASGAGVALFIIVMLAVVYFVARDQ